MREFFAIDLSSRSNALSTATFSCFFCNRKGEKKKGLEMSIDGGERVNARV